MRLDDGRILQFNPDGSVTARNIMRPDGTMLYPGPLEETFSAEAIRAVALDVPQEDTDGQSTEVAG